LQLQTKSKIFWFKKFPSGYGTGIKQEEVEEKPNPFTNVMFCCDHNTVYNRFKGCPECNEKCAYAMMSIKTEQDSENERLNYKSG
jgi:hypothetical protein